MLLYGHYCMDNRGNSRANDLVHAPKTDFLEGYVYMYVYMYVYVYMYMYMYMYMHVFVLGRAALSQRRQTLSCLQAVGSELSVTDGTGAPDPNCRHLVNWRL